MKQKKEIKDVSVLENIFKELKGQKFRLSCGHCVTIGHNFGNNIIVLNGKDPKIICTDCGY